MAPRTIPDATHAVARAVEPTPTAWRLFVAIDVGDAARAAIRTAQEHCREAGFPLRPVATAGAHLTLRFLGTTDPTRVPVLGAALRTVAAERGPFALHTAAPGAFPSAARARVLWLGLAGSLTQLSALQRATAAALADCGVPHERKLFHPHTPDDRADRGLDGAARRAYRRAPGRVARGRRAAPGDGDPPVAEYPRPRWGALHHCADRAAVRGRIGESLAPFLC